jgi:hypothetical protein
MAEQVPVEVQRVIDSAMAGKIPIMNEISADPVHIGLDSGTKLSDLQAGQPIHLYGFNKDSLDKLDESAPVSSIIKPLKGWAVPLILHGKFRLLFLIDLNSSEKWHVDGFGFGGYAISWQTICKIWPESKGYHPIFIGHLIGQAFFYVPEKGDKNLTRFASAMHKSDNLDSLYANLESSSFNLFKKVKHHVQPQPAGGR